MTKEYFTLEHIDLWQDTGSLPPLILYAVPVMLAFVVVEYFLSMRRNRKLYENKDLLSSIGIGIGYLAVTGGTQTITFLIILWVYNHVPFAIPVTWWSFALCFIWLDFWRYWAHRWAHEQRFLWATHITHHSSSKYNFAVSFRLSWVDQIKLIFFLTIPAVGLHPIVFFLSHQIAVLYQFWIHTELIHKLPKAIEYIFATPSHHRVHHATNPQYIDKNYGSTFIFWDRMFGTYAEEVEQPIYGIIDPPDTYNPIHLTFHGFYDIWRDLKRARNFREGCKLVFGRPGIEKQIFATHPTLLTAPTAPSAPSKAAPKSAPLPVTAKRSSDS